MPYVDLVTLKSGLDLSNTNDHDAVLELYRQASAERCDHYTGRVYGEVGEGFEQHTRTAQVHQLEAVSGLVLREWPVISVTTITLDDVAQVEDTDYRIDLRIGVITFIDSASYETRVSGVLKITFEAGFTPAPADLSLCCMRLSAYWFSRKATEGMGSQLIGDLQESYRRPEELVILNDTIGHYRLHPVG